MSHNVKHMLRTCSGLPSILATVCDIFFIIACPSDLLNFSVVAITHVGIVFVFSFSLLDEQKGEGLFAAYEVVRSFNRTLVRVSLVPVTC